MKGIEGRDMPNGFPCTSYGKQAHRIRTLRVLEKPDGQAVDAFVSSPVAFRERP